MTYGAEPFDLEAACVLIVHPKTGKVLTVSRHDDPTAKGLPAGKREKGERLIETAERELMEETGLRMNPKTAVLLHDAPCTDFAQGTVSRSVTYLVTEWSGTPRSSPEGVVSWEPWEAIVFGPFGEYNAELARLYREFIARKRHGS